MIRIFFSFLVVNVNIADFSISNFILHTPSEVSGLVEGEARVRPVLRHAQPTWLQLHSQDQQKEFSLFFAQKL